MEISGHIGDREVAANGRQTAGGRLREERWRRVRRLRLKSWCFFVFLPLAVFIVFGLLEVGAYYLAQLVPGLSRHDASVYGFAAQVATAILFIAAGAYVIFSARTKAWIRHLGRRAPWALSPRPMPRAKLHARYCAARNRGTATFFLGFSTMMVVYAWRDVSKPLASERQPILDVVELLVVIALLANVCRFLTCFRERLILVVAAVDCAILFLLGVAPSIGERHASILRETRLVLWAVAVLASLALLKSALRSPPPGT